jgi:hypothetical protein
VARGAPRPVQGRQRATRRRLAAIGPDNRALWASAAREASGSLAALARRLQPGQRAELARAADALARAGQLPRGQRRGYRDPALSAMSGVARVVTDAMLINMPGLATVTLIRQIGQLAAEVGKAHAAAARAAEAQASRAAAEHTLAYTRVVQRIGGIGETAPPARRSGDTEHVSPRSPEHGGRRGPATGSGSGRRRLRTAREFYESITTAAARMTGHASPAADLAAVATPVPIDTTLRHTTGRTTLPTQRAGQQPPEQRPPVVRRPPPTRAHNHHRHQPPRQTGIAHEQR